MTPVSRAAAGSWLLLSALLLIHAADVDNNIYPLRPGGPPSGVDLGPQRPQGQFPQGVGPAYVVDLGPQRPHGQFPPPQDAVEVIHTIGDDSVLAPRAWPRPSPAGVDLGPHRPAGQTDPNGPPGANGDLGPQRPHGQFLPAQQHPLGLGLQDDEYSSDFQMYWNVPSFMCHRYGLPFSNLSGRYGIVQNDDDVFRGSRIAILYDPGLYPALISSDGTVKPRNGGVPQEGNLTLHLERLQQSIEDQVPADFDGLGVIDFEAWRPVWAQNFGTLRAYQQYSLQVEQRRTPTASAATLQTKATQRFEAAAKEYFLESLKLAQRLRPNGRWGYYAFPYCFNSNDDNFDCSDNLREQNSNIQWLFDASTALFPSVYLSKADRSADDEFLFILHKLREAARVAGGRNIVYPYLWYRYRDAGFLSDDDLRSSVALPRAMGLAGAIVWGSSGDMNTESKCTTLNAQLEERLGPTIRKYASTLSEERVRDYVRQRSPGGSGGSGRL